MSKLTEEQKELVRELRGVDQDLSMSKRVALSQALGIKKKNLITKRERADYELMLLNRIGELEQKLGLDDDNN